MSEFFVVYFFILVFVSYSHEFINILFCKIVLILGGLHEFLTQNVKDGNHAPFTSFHVFFTSFHVISRHFISFHMISRYCLQIFAKLQIILFSKKLLRKGKPQFFKIFLNFTSFHAISRHFTLFPANFC